MTTYPAYPPTHQQYTTGDDNSDKSHQLDYLHPQRSLPVHFSPHSPSYKPSSPHAEWQPTLHSYPSYSTAASSVVDLPIHVDTHQPHPRRTSVWQRLLPDSVPCRLYILIVVLQTILDLGMEGILLFKFIQAAAVNPDIKVSSARSLPVYFSIFGFAHVFQFILAVDAVFMRNTLQFFFLTAFNFILLIYAVVQVFEIKSIVDVSSTAQGILAVPTHVLTALVPCVIGLAELAYIVLGWSIWREFGWKVYKRLGADRRVRRLYMHYQILQCIMKFDVFFFAGFSIQLIWMVLQKTNVEYAVTVAALPASLVVLVAGHIGARYEHKPLMYAFMLSCAGGCGYFVFKLFRIVEQKHLPTILPVFKTLCAFAGISIFFFLATFTWSCIVLRNFGSGLKYHLSKNKPSPIQRQQSEGAQSKIGQKLNRMSID